MKPSLRHKFVEIQNDGASLIVERAIAVEVPCAVEVNGLGYAVMMITPSDLTDYAYGFCLSEGLIDVAQNLLDVDTRSTEDGILLRVTTSLELRDRVVERIRHRISDSACGICGIENLEQALRSPPIVQARSEPVSPDSVFGALKAMRRHEPLNKATGATHAALACEAAGTVVHSRGDIGRHNAFDKLIGAIARAGEDWKDRFALLSSRCSYELIEKAARVQCSAVVSVSAAWSLALDRARQANTQITSLARHDSILCSNAEGLW